MSKISDLTAAVQALKDAVASVKAPAAELDSTDQAALDQAVGDITAATAELQQLEQPAAPPAPAPAETTTTQAPPAQG